MNTLTTIKKAGIAMASVMAYKGDAMTLLAMSIDKSIITNFTGFSIKVTPPGKQPFFLFNRFTYGDDILIKNGIDPKRPETRLSDVSPIQTFRWVHTPNTDHNINKMIFGKYKYEITPRYLINDILQPLDTTLTVSFLFDISPYKSGDFQIGFTRGFIESQAYTRHFGLNNKIRPNKTDLLFNTNTLSGPTADDKAKNPGLQNYTFELQHAWLGWQARQRIIDFLDETLKDKNLSLDTFAFDLDEPFICKTILQLAKEGRARMILDNSTGHFEADSFEQKFDVLYRSGAKDKNSIARGAFKALSHCKVLIQKLNGVPIKVLTGSTNFSTNGLYINANHVIIFNNKEVAQLYEDVFEKSFGQTLMNHFAGTKEGTDDHPFKEMDLPEMTIRFSPHTKAVAQVFFDLINKRILAAETDVLFAIMKDNSKSSILDAIQQQVRSDKVFTYGITDVIADKAEIMLYKPESKLGIRVAGKPGQFILPPPFEPESNIPGISIHHKFVVVDFKGANPVVYCGSSNLAFGPEQKNGDNLIEIRDKDAVTVFAIEAIRLVDHFQFRNALFIAQNKAGAGNQTVPIFLHGSKEKNWVNKYYDTKDLKSLERTLLIS